MISVKNVTKKFGKLEVLRGVNCEIKAGEVVAIIGPSGSGKSTILRCMNLLEVPSSGEIWLEDELISDVDPYLHDEIIEVSASYKKYGENADAKKKAGTKAKMFDIIADTTALTNGEHTVTFVTKFVNNKTCDLITLNLNVGGSNAGCADGSESSSESGEAEDGCKSSIAVGIALPISIFAGAILIKKKKED